jgi:GAF domain-containing protein
MGTPPPTGPAEISDAMDQGVRAVEPIPETRHALEHYRQAGEDEIEAELTRMGRRALEIVPECVGLSLGLLRDGLTFTLAATDDEVAGLDAVQYIDGGPCVGAAQDGREVEVDELLGEENWHMFAQASAAAGVRSSLTLPILDNRGSVIGTINLYASTPNAFEAQTEQLADALGSSAAKAMRNADLSFTTRLAAAQAPRQLVEADEVNTALWIIAASQEVDLATARERLRAAASRAGISDAKAAQAVIGLLSK